MNISPEVAELLKAGYSKTEVFERLVPKVKKQKNLARAISEFPSAHLFREHQNLITQFYKYFLVYGTVLAFVGLVAIFYTDHWPIIVGYVIGMIIILRMPYKFGKGFRGMMHLQVFMSLVFSTYYPIGLLITCLKHPEIKFSQLEIVFNILNIVFILYSMITTIYGFKTLKVVFKKEMFFGRWKWDKENLKPIFLEESE